MPGRTLPSITRADVESHNTTESCYVTLGRKVYDVTEFLEGHPGGPELLMEYAGKDVETILQDDDSHTHSDSAYEILEEFLIGFLAEDKATNGSANGHAKANGTANGTANGVANGATNDQEVKYVYAATGMSSEEDLSRETDLVDDYKTHKFLDLNKPLLMQVWRGGFSKEFYLEQIHRPRHYKGGESAPIFGNFLEPLSKTPWWVVPLVWVPCVLYGLSLASEGLPISQLFGYWVFGVLFWTLLEYILHRFLFHLDEYLPDHGAFLTLHFLLHGVHHYLPMDRLRLVMPPTLFAVLAAPFWKFAHFVLFYNWHAATAAYCGGISGYIAYDLTHYFLHHKKLPSYYQGLKKYHLQHHFADYQNGFGVTSAFWDRVFGTELQIPPPKLVKTS